jgi:hypothetical protein
MKLMKVQILHDFDLYNYFYIYIVCIATCVEMSPVKNTDRRIAQ